MVAKTIQRGVEAVSTTDVSSGTETGKSLFDSLSRYWDIFMTFFRRFILAVIVVLVLLYISTWIANKLRNKIIERNSMGGTNDDNVEKVANLIKDVVYGALFIFSIFIGFQIVGLDVALILGGVSFGIGMAFKEILGNMVAGILILTTKHYALGDTIEIDGPGYFGKIEEITIRYTVIRTWQKRRIIVPNLTLITSAVKTFSSEEFIKRDLIVSVHYDTDLNAACEIMKNAMKTASFVIDPDKTVVRVAEMGESGINLKGIYSLAPKGKVPGPKADSELRKLIKKAFDENNINIPYPHMVVTVDKNDKNLLGSALYLMKNSKPQQ